MHLKHKLKQIRFLLLIAGLTAVFTGIVQKPFASTAESSRYSILLEETTSEKGTEMFSGLFGLGTDEIIVYAAEQKAADKKAPSYTEEDLKYLAAIIYCEARGEEYKGKLAVANVILNRVESDIFDHVTSVEEVIYDVSRWGRQFSPAYVKKNGKWTKKGAPMEKALKLYEKGGYKDKAEEAQMKECIKAAKAALNGKRAVSKKVLYFNSNISTTKKKCKKQGITYVVIGCHIFYRAS